MEVEEHFLECGLHVFEPIPAGGGEELGPGVVGGEKLAAPFRKQFDFQRAIIGIGDSVGPGLPEVAQEDRDAFVVFVNSEPAIGRANGLLGESGGAKDLAGGMEGLAQGGGVGGGRLPDAVGAKTDGGGGGVADVEAKFEVQRVKVERPGNIGIERGVL